MKKILLLVFSFIYFSSFAQLDREHWFAPMYDGQSNASGYEQFLHLSTNEKTPFTVKVYNNNIVIEQRTISKGNPAVINISRDYIITRDPSALLKVGTRGLYVKADRPCFANLRFGVSNHAEIITSKGTAGIGTKFYTVVAPNVQNSTNLGFAASFLATEDNTNVTVNNFKKTISFTNGANAKTISFTLNKGQSYIIDGRSFNGAQQDGFIGATVTSDKPISMSNGNFNGQYATTDTNEGSDILMDQSVPVDKLGNEFVIVKGYGEIGNNMEGAIIVATEKNTAFYLNDSTVPFATLANEGDHYVINETNYVNRSNGHYNLHIRTDKNVYVYQLLGGVDFGASVLATGGMNYIPPLNCYLPRTIDEISYINKIKQNDSDTRFVTKLNIITEKGAEVKVNGVVPNVIDGPYDISNISTSQTWVTYSIPNVKGNITVESTKAVTAGIASGNLAFGYGGYFAGFSSIPLILKTEGDCLPGVKLEVTKGFLSYQWVEKINGIYVPAPGVNDQYTYIPTQAGIYAVKVQQGSCPEIQTNDFKFYNCTTYTNYDYDICTEDNITPKFALSTQSVNVSTLTVDTPPTKGIVTINKTDPTDLLTYGKVIYKAFPNAIGTDTFKYSFCGEGALPDCETVQATIHLNQIEKYNDVLKGCSTTSTANFNLALAGITPDATVTKRFFKDAAYLDEIPVGQLAQYNSAPGFVYVKLSNAFGCIETATIELKIIVPPVVTPALYTIMHCDEDIDGVLDGTYKVVLTSITPLVVQNATAFTVKYYDEEAKATAGIVNTDIKGTFSFTGNRSIWIRVDSPEVCAPVIKEILLQTGNKFIIATPIEKNVCDNNLDNTEEINLESYTNLFTTNPFDDVKFYDDLIKAQNGKINENILAPQTITGDKTFYYRFKKDSVCDALGTLNLLFKKSTPTALKDSYTVCEGSSITLTAEPAPTYKAWSWIKAGVNYSPTNIATLSAGVYTVSFTNDSNCVFTKTITILESPEPIWNIAAYNATNCDNDFSGIIKVKFSTITPLIITNASLFKVEYSLLSDFSILLPNDWTYTANTTVYVRASSEFCAAVIKTIDFKVGAQLTLIKKIVAKNVCDDNLDNTENINLDNYLLDFITNPYDSVKYFDNLIKAQNNLPGQNILAPQTITTDKTYYYRFKKDGVCDALGTLNLLFKKSTPTALKDTYTVCEGSSVTLTAEPAPTYKAWSWIKAGVNYSPTNIATLSAGVYTVSFTNDSNCVFTKTITIKDSPKAVFTLDRYNATLCDDNFDGSIEVKFSRITPFIVQKFALYTIRYYTSQAFADAGGTNNLPDDWSFTTNTKIYVRVDSPACPYITGIIDFKFGNNLPLLRYDDTITICDDNLDGIKTINLLDYYKGFYSSSPFSLGFYATLQDAQLNSNGLDAYLPVEINDTRTFYLRIGKKDFCSSIAKLTLKIKIPTKSDILEDKQICPEKTTTLDAGAGFTDYLWNTGAKTESIKNVAVGDYWVDLTFDGCTYRQNVSVTAVELPKIINLDIQGTTVTVTASGGKKPYQYSVDGINYQASNILNNVPAGEQTIYVISADQCAPVTAKVYIIRILNVITPNEDGLNDLLDYSALLNKEEPFLQIFDRFGNIVFKGDQSNRFIWNGKTADKTVASSNYWYVLQWREIGATTVTKVTGWVLVKSR